MIYSKNESEEDENSENMEIKTSDRRLFMYFNYMNFNQNRRRKKFIYDKKIQTKKNDLFISKTDSIFILNKNDNLFERDIIKNNFISIIEMIINNIIIGYKLNFFQGIKEIKSISIICTIFENHKKKIIRQYFDILKDNININNSKNNSIKQIEDHSLNESEEKMKENLDEKNKLEKKFELLRINLLKYIFCKK